MQSHSVSHGARAALWVLFGALSLGCASAGSAAGGPHHRAGFPEASGNDEVMRDDVPAQSGTALTVTLSAEPEITLGQDEQVGVHVAITNEGSEEVLMEALAGELRIDGQAAFPFDLSGRGVTRLAPGQTAEFDQNLGVRLFDAPGDHTLQLDIGEDHSLPIHVIVRE